MVGARAASPRQPERCRAAESSRVWVAAELLPACEIDGDQVRQDHVLQLDR